MARSTLLGLMAAMTAAAVAANATFPARATSDTLATLAAPRWVDQTIYLPNCLSIKCGCGCYFDGSCEPDCGPW
jgi:hypothetical protein